MKYLENNGLAGEGGSGRGRRYLPVFLAICVGCILSIAGFYFANKIEHQARQSSFQRIADDRVRAVRNKLESTIAILQSIDGLFAASKIVDRQEFQAFIESYGIDAAVQALEWIPRVSGSDRKIFEDSARRDGIPEFRFTERSSDGRMVAAADREEYFPVYYLEPHSGNEAALGFDLGSSETRLDALNRARDSGEMVATARITLVQETGDQSGFLVFAPLYRNGKPTGTLAERRENSIGFGLGVFRIGDLIDAAIGASPSSTSPAAIRIFDTSAPEDNQLLYPNASAPGNEAFVRPAIFYSRTIDVAGRKWSVEIVPTSESRFSDFAWQPWAILLAGFLFTSLLALYLRLTIGSTARMEVLVNERTIELQQSAQDLTRSNAELEQFAYVASHDLKAPLRGIDNLVQWIEEDLNEVLVGDSRANMNLLRGRVNRLERLLDDLLQYSRAGTRDEKTSTVDTRSLVDEIVTISSAPTGTTIAAKGDLPTFRTQRTPLEQVLRNLIANAIKHHDRDDAHVEISARDLGDRYEFTVSDDGPGIEPKFAQKVFQMFQTLRPRDEVEGSGMGLTIVRKLVERQGGEVRLVSRENSRGAAFLFDWKKAVEGSGQ